RAGTCGDGHRLGDGPAGRALRDDEAWRDDPGRPLCAALRGKQATPRPELRRGSRAVHGYDRRRHRAREHILREAHLHDARHDHHRGGHPDVWAEPALCFPWRQDRGWRNRGARLAEAAGDADLARRPGDDGGRHAVAARSPASRGRAGAPQAAYCRRGGDGMSRLKATILAAVLVLASSFAAHAVRPDEVLADPALEARARGISAELRCMVCQNQSIDDSDADLAHDLRVLVRERLKAGDTDQEVVDYIVSRYGEFVLLKPRFNLRNALLWTAPLLILV